MHPFDCVIYCTGKISIDDLRAKIASLLGADKIMISFIEIDFYELSVRLNDEYNSEKEIDFPDGFLFFKFIIDVGFNKIGSIKECVPKISKILEWLWLIGMPAVASCDYEDLLPNDGGYKSKIIPWPPKM